MVLLLSIIWRLSLNIEIMLNYEIVNDFYICIIIIKNNAINWKLGTINRLFLLIFNIISNHQHRYFGINHKL
jgi:hypothetical protein